MCSRLGKKSLCSRIQLNDSPFPECTAVRGTRYTLVSFILRDSKNRKDSIHGQTVAGELTSGSALHLGGGQFTY